MVSAASTAAYAKSARLVRVVIVIGEYTGRSTVVIAREDRRPDDTAPVAEARALDAKRAAREDRRHRWNARRRGLEERRHRFDDAAAEHEHAWVHERDVVGERLHEEPLRV